MKKKQILTLGVIFLLGILFWFYPHPQAIPDRGWHLLVIFVATIATIIAKPLPMGAVAILATAVAVLTNTLSLEEALTGFESEIAWLVVFAFFISVGFIKTGLGSRIAYFFVTIFGRKTLGLSYGLLLSELILAPAIPSVTARSGGVIFPIILSLAKSFGSEPTKKTERQIGSFLIKVAYQGSAITSAMFLTAMAANPLIAGLIKDAGFNFSWGMWALAAMIPGILSLIVIPFVVYKMYPPEIQNTPDAPKLAKNKLKEMGPLSFKEWAMLGVFILLLVLWIFGTHFAVKATTAALIGLALLLLFQVLEWKDITHEDKAWDTFIWFSILIMLATSLNKLGVTPWFSEQVVSLVQGFHWMTAFGILFLVYFYSHYFFASNTAHVGAMFPAFLMVAIALGTPAGLAIASLAFASNLFGGLTHYGSGPAPLFYGAGYVDVKTWWKLGFIISLINIVIWMGLGSLWWKVIGLW